MKKVKNFLSKNKILVATALTALMASSAQAAVTYDKANGLSGSIDLDLFYQGAVILLGAITTIWGVKKVFAMFGR